MKGFIATTALVTSVLALSPALAQEEKKERELSTDRPDKTESPYTVPTGRFQIETDIVNLTQDNSTVTDPVSGASLEATSREYAIAASNLKYGLANDLDLQVVVETHKIAETEAGGQTVRVSAFGDTTVRLKWNAFGNDGGDVALALMPYAKLPTNGGALGNKSVEGGVIVPIGFSLPHEWNAGVMAVISKDRNADDKDDHTTFVSSFTFSHDIAGELGGYVEYYSESSTEPGAMWVATVDTGLTYKFTPELQGDIGCNFGVTEAAPDLNPFVGVSARF